jgi:anti-sigma factor RsiW
MEAYGHISDEELVMFSDGEMSTRRTGEVKAHLAACRRCRARRIGLERAMETFQALRIRQLQLLAPPLERTQAALPPPLAMSPGGQLYHFWLRTSIR